MINNFIFFLGLPCSGKSTIINNNYINNGSGTLFNNVSDWSYEDDKKFYEFIDIRLRYLYKIDTIIISADEIKKYLDGYDNLHPEKVHELSVQLAKRSILYIASHKTITKNIILDGGGINGHYNLSIIKYLREHNVKNIICYFMDTPINVCLKRLESRDRKVPVDDIYRKNLKLEACRNRYIDIVDEFIRVDYFTNKYLFLDMDGTLACYGKAKKDINGNSDFVSSQLFKNLKPVQHVIEFVKEHYKNKMQNVYIITACANSIAWKEKNEWLDKYFPEIPNDNRLFVGNKNYKHVFIDQFLHMNKWKPNEVTLIDDFHDTLDKCDTIGINTIHPSNIYAMFDKYSHQS